ncbi:MAG TPA: transaldolase [Gemmatimonadota bacterium]|nr:transaldolase [Gemmatimonadota bacterium]
MPNPLNRLHDLGQSIWLDYLRRDMLEDGTQARLIRDDDLSGQTSNPSIFQKAIAESELYDDDIRAAGSGTDPSSILDSIMIEDIRTAAALFRPVYDRTSGEDGFISVEVSPDIAWDTEASVAEARRLWNAIDRPNLMVKIPGTAAGLPAIRDCLAEGININITLLFSVDRYQEVMDAWFEAMERRVERGQPIDRLASVASFFVSRVDTKVDQRIGERLARVTDDERARLEALEGRIGIDNARIAFEAYEDRFGDERFAALAARGARPQKPLWASTSTKNPEYPDVYYVEALLAPGTVNTLPPETLEAYRDHGDPAVRIHEDLDGAHRRLAELGELGIDFQVVLEELEKEGVEKFSKSYHELLDAIEEKQRQVQPA